MSFAFSYTFVFSVGFPMGDAISLLPALFWALDARRWAALGGVSALEFLAGQPESALVVFLALGAWFLAQRPAWRDQLRAAGAVAAGALVALPQLLPLVQYVSLSAAGELRREYIPLFYSPHTLVDFLTPMFFGTSSPRNWWGSNEGGYFGLLPAMVGAAWVLCRPREAARNPFLWIFLGSLAFIHQVPPLGWLLKLPLLRTIYVTKFWAVAVFGGAMLAGFGGDALRRRRISYKALYGVSAALAVAMLGARWYFAGFISALDLAGYERRVLLLFFGFLALAIGTLRFRPAAAALLVFIESFVYLGGYNTAADARLLYPRTPVVAFLQRDPERARIWGDGVFPPNTASVYGLEDARGYDAVTAMHYFRYMAAVDGSFPDLLSRLDLRQGPPARDTLFKRDRFQRPLTYWGEGYRDFLRRVYHWNDRLTRLDRPALFDLLNVKYLLVARGARPPAGAEDYTLVYSGEVDAYENPHRLPRAFVVGAWEYAGDDDAALAAIRRPGFNPRAAAVLCCASGAAGRAFEGVRPAAILRYSASEVVVRAAGPGVLVLADAYYPGWRAEGYRLYRGNCLFRAVALRQGTQTVRFTFRPWRDWQWHW